MSRAYKLTKLAEIDLIGIAKYGMDRWGEDRARTYLERLKERCAWLAENPFTGMERPDILKESRVFRKGEHLIVYRVCDEVIEILGVPHGSMDLGRHFDHTKDG